MFDISLKMRLWLWTFIGITSLTFSGWIPKIAPVGASDNLFPVRNVTGGTLTNPEGMAVDAKGNVWVANYDNNSVTKLDPNGKPISPERGFTGGGLSKPLGIAIDAVGNVWVANYGNNSVTKLDSSGNPLSPPNGFTGDGLNKPLGIAIDAMGNVWVANYGNNSVTKLDSSGRPLSPSEGFIAKGLKLPFGIAIDAAGNVWVANEGNRITELIGAASPLSEEGEFSENLLESLLNRGEKTMETLNIFGAEMTRHELLLLQIIVGVGFVGWMFLLLVQTVWLSNPPGEESGLDEYGCHYDRKTGVYHCVSGRLAGRDFSSRKEMLKLAA